MLLLVLALNVTPEQVLGGAAFETLAAQTDSRCPARHVRAITPANLDFAQEAFMERLSVRDRTRLASANEAERRCANRDGLACPTTATLEAMRKTKLLSRFAAYVCIPSKPVA
jgi:hypothetical protein